MTTVNTTGTNYLVAMGFKPDFDYCSNLNTVKKRFLKLELEYNSDRGTINDTQFRTIEKAYHNIMTMAFQQIDKNKNTDRPQLSIASKIMILLISCAVGYTIAIQLTFNNADLCNYL